MPIANVIACCSAGTADVTSSINGGATASKGTPNKVNSSRRRGDVEARINRMGQDAQGEEVYMAGVADSDNAAASGSGT